MKTIQVKDTKSFTTSYGKQIQVIEGYLLLIPVTSEDKPFETTVRQGDCSAEYFRFSCPKRNCELKPVIVSEPEDMEEGELCLYTNGDGKNGQLQWIAPFVAGSSGAKYKILAHPINFSRKQLQAIQDEKLKDGQKVFVECEVKKIPTFEDLTKEVRKIKFNTVGEITLHPCEEKTFSLTQVIKLCTSAFEAGQMYCATEGKIYPQSDNLETWITKNIQKL